MQCQNFQNNKILLKRAETNECIIPIVFNGVLLCQGYMLYCCRFLPFILHESHTSELLFGYQTNNAKYIYSYTFIVQQT
jgi:hypothetical protein